MNFKNHKTKIVAIKLLTLGAFISSSSGLIRLGLFIIGIRFKVAVTESILEIIPRTTKKRTRHEKCLYKMYMFVMNYIAFQFTIKPALNEFCLMYFGDGSGKGMMIMLKEHVINDVQLNAYKFYYDLITMSCQNAAYTELALIFKGFTGAIFNLWDGSKYERAVNVIKIGVLNEVAFCWKGKRWDSGVPFEKQKLNHRIIDSTINELIHTLLLRDLLSNGVKFIDLKSMHLRKNITERISAKMPDIINEYIAIIIPENIRAHIITLLSGILYIGTLHLIKHVHVDKN